MIISGSEVRKMKGGKNLPDSLKNISLIETKEVQIVNSPLSFSSKIIELQENNQNSVSNKIEDLKKEIKELQRTSKDSVEIQEKQYELQKEIEYKKEHDYKSPFAKEVTEKKEIIYNQTENSTPLLKKEEKKNKMGSFLKSSLISLLLGKMFYPLIKPYITNIKEILYDKFKNNLLPWIKENTSFIVQPIQNWLKTDGLKMLLDSTGFIRKTIFGLLTNTVYPWIRDNGIDFLKNSVIPLGEKFLTYFRTTVWPTFMRDIFPQIKDNIGTVIKGLAIGYMFLNPIKTLKMVTGTLVSASSFLVKNILKGSLIGMMTTLKGLAMSSMNFLKIGSDNNKKSGIGSMLENIKSGKIGKGIKGIIKVFKPLLRVVPFLGLVVTIYDLLETLFPNLMSSVKDFISQIPSKILELGSNLWDSITSGLDSITSWISEKFKKVPEYFEKAIRSYPLIGNKIADYIFLDKRDRINKSRKEKLREHVEENLIKSKVIEHNSFSKDEIKNWSKIKKLSIRKLTLLSESENLRETDKKKIKLIIGSKKKEREKKKPNTLTDEQKLSSLKKGEQYLLKRVEQIRTDKTIPEDKKLDLYEGINKAIQYNIKQQKVLEDKISIRKIDNKKVILKKEQEKQISNSSNVPLIKPELPKEGTHRKRHRSGNHNRLYNYILKTETFTPKAFWDYKQWTNGYGTKAKNKDEVIDEPTAMRRFKHHVDSNLSKVEQFVPPQSPLGLVDALTSLSYNSGYKWMSSGLGKAVKRLDYEDIKRRFVQYNKVRKHGKLVESKGLTKRRKEEIAWLDNKEVKQNKTILLPNVEDKKENINIPKQPDLISKESKLKPTLIEKVKEKSTKVLSSVGDVIKTIDEKSLKMVQDFLSDNNIMGKVDNLSNASSNIIKKIDTSSLKMVQDTLHKVNQAEIFNSTPRMGQVDNKTKELSSLVAKTKEFKKIEQNPEQQPIININNTKSDNEPSINLESSKFMNESLSLLGSIL